MAKLVWFFTAITAIFCGSSTLVMSSVKVMSQYARVDNDLFASIYISLVGDQFSSSFGQCASACNLHGDDCHGYVFQTSSCNGNTPKTVKFCQLVASVSQASVAIIYTSTSCQQLYVNAKWRISDSIAHYEYMNLTVATEPSVSTMSVFGWIIFQQRTPVGSSFNWKRLWLEYKNGFGSIGSNFWLGLERVHLMSSSTKHRMRIEMRMTSTGRWYSVEYWSFIIGDEQVTKYQLNVDGYSGDGGDGLRYQMENRWYHNGMPFSTTDVNNVPNTWTVCAVTYRGGWWFNNCYWVCLTCDDAFTEWDSVPDTSDYSLRTTRMMIKPQ